MLFRPSTSLTTILVYALFMVCLLTHCSYAQDERVRLEAKINGSPVQLIFDSCADVFTLLPDSVRKLGLTWTSAPTNIPATQRAFIIGRTETCAVDFFWAEGRTQLNFTTFFVVDTPASWDPSYAGIVPWGALSKEIFSLDGEAGRLKAAIAPPPDIAQWSQFLLRNDLPRMALEARDQDGIDGTIWIDTGSPNGVFLTPVRWQAWKAAHPHMPTTLRYLFTPNEGAIVMEEAWADQISIGSLVLSNVPVMQWPRSYSTNDMALLGLYALRGLDFIVDGQHSVAYLRSKKPRHAEYNYNRMGALFCQSTNVGELVARVMCGGPAQEAGLQNNDVLLGINDQEPARWSDVGFVAQAAGTKIKFTLRRAEQVTNITVTFRDFLSTAIATKQR